MWYIETFTGPWKQDWLTLATAIQYITQLTFSTAIQYITHFLFYNNVNSTQIFNKIHSERPQNWSLFLWRLDTQGSKPPQPSDSGSVNTNIVIEPNYVNAPGGHGGSVGGGGGGRVLQIGDSKEIV